MEGRQGRWWLILAVFAVLVAGALFLRSRGPDLGPLCLIRWMTGYQCPGCGMTRGVYALLQGDWVLAFRMNPLMMVVFPLVLGWGCWRWLRDGSVVPRSAWERWSVVGIVVALIVYGVLRNLPVEPFCRLAPPQ